MSDVSQFMSPGASSDTIAAAENESGGLPQKAFSAEYKIPTLIKRTDTFPLVATGQSNSSGIVSPVGISGANESSSGAIQPDGTLARGMQAYNVGTGWWLGVDKGIPKFSMGNAGGNIITWDGTTLAITGNLTATTGTIGGFTIGATTVSATNLTLTSGAANAANIAVGTGSNLAGLNSANAGTDIAIWAGSTYANRATAPFNVTAAGAVTGSSVTITGGSVSGTPISGIPNNASTDISLLEFTQNMAFTSNSATQVNWGSGTIQLSNGRSFAISSGNTGSMAALTYIYLDTGVSTTALQKTTTYSTAIGANKILIAAAQNNATGASVITYGGGQPVLDGAGNIVALSITGASIAASTITAGKISVSQLSAIAADLGSITAGTVVLPTTGYVRSGQTDFNTGTGFFIGGSGGVAKLSIGVGGSTTNNLTWDGTTLTVNGYVVTGKGSFGGDGSDGALTIASGTTTLSAASASTLIKNYSSISITGTGTLAFSNPATNGTIITLKSQGAVTLTSSSAPMIDGSAMGAAGTAGAATPNPGSNSIGSVTSATGGAGGSVGTGGAASALIYGIIAKVTNIVAGAGGGGGGLGPGASLNGAGGRGGSGLFVECAGAWNFTTASGISVAGGAGVNGGNGGGSAGGGGGGGGGGGTFIAFYNTLTANSGTVTVSGGIGGTGGTGGSGTGGSGGGGGGGATTAGASGSANSGSNGGGGGNGGTGYSLVIANNFFA